MPQAQLPPDVEVAGREVGDDEVGLREVGDHRLQHHARVDRLVGAPVVQLRVLEGRNQQPPVGAVAVDLGAGRRIELSPVGHHHEARPVARGVARIDSQLARAAYPARLHHLLDGRPLPSLRDREDEEAPARVGGQALGVVEDVEVRALVGLGARRHPQLVHHADLPHLGDDGIEPRAPAGLDGVLAEHLGRRGQDDLHARVLPLGVEGKGRLEHQQVGAAGGRAHDGLRLSLREQPPQTLGHALVAVLRKGRRAPPGVRVDH